MASRNVKWPFAPQSHARHLSHRRLTNVGLVVCVVNCWTTGAHGDAFSDGIQQQRRHQREQLTPGSSYVGRPADDDQLDGIQDGASSGPATRLTVQPGEFRCVSSAIESRVSAGSLRSGSPPSFRVHGPAPTRAALPVPPGPCLP